MKIFLNFASVFLALSILSSFTYRLNELTEVALVSTSNSSRLDRSNQMQENPFEKFKGAWVMKDDIFESNRGGEYKANVNPNRSFVCKEVGTPNSVVWINDFDGFRYAMFWTYDFKNKQVHHLSMSSDIARGIGKFSDNGDLELKLIFENNCEKCYRIYSYQWKSGNEFFFRATFYQDNEPTGDYYGGTLLRKTNDKD